jgi:hypothetical protein
MKKGRKEGSDIEGRTEGILLKKDERATDGRTDVRKEGRKGGRKHGRKEG